MIQQDRNRTDRYFLVSTMYNLWKSRTEAKDSFPVAGGRLLVLSDSDFQPFLGLERGDHERAPVQVPEGGATPCRP